MSKKQEAKRAASSVLWGMVGAWLWQSVGRKLLDRIPVWWRIVGGFLLAGLLLVFSPWRELAWPVLVASFGLLAATIYRRHRKQVAGPERIVREWKTTVADNGTLAAVLKGSTARVAAKDATGFTIAVDLAGGRTPAEVQKLTPNLESVFKTRPGSLRVTADSTTAHTVLLRFVTTDLLAQPMRWQPDTFPVTAFTPIRLGGGEDGEQVTLRLIPQPGQGVSGLVAGLPGSGKSGILNVLVAHFAACPDVVLAGIDPQGTELEPWEDVFEPSLLALGHDGNPRAVLLRLIDLMKSREKWLRRHKQRVWTPTPETPEVVLICDEVADLADDFDLMDEIARKGRKTGIHVILATQRPSLASLGPEGKETLAKLPLGICLAVANTREVDVVLGPGAAGMGWRADILLHQPGEFLIRDADHQTVRRARAFWVTDDDVRAQVSATRDRRPRLEEQTPALAVAEG